jgi:hypothetical protein
MDAWRLFQSAKQNDGSWDLSRKDAEAGGQATPYLTLLEDKAMLCRVPSLLPSILGWKRLLLLLDHN